MNTTKNNPRMIDGYTLEKLNVYDAEIYVSHKDNSKWCVINLVSGEQITMCVWKEKENHDGLFYEEGYLDKPTRNRFEALTPTKCELLD